MVDSDTSADTTPLHGPGSEPVTDTNFGNRLAGHPVEITHELEPMILGAAGGRGTLAEPMPPLAALVVASAFDAALHDAYGKAHGLNCYHTYGPDFLPADLGHFLGSEFAGEHLDRYVSRVAKPSMPG